MVSWVERVPAAAGVDLTHRCFQRKSVLREYDLAKESVHTNENKHISTLMTHVCTRVSSVSNVLACHVCFVRWKAIIDHLLTHEKTMFKDLMSTYILHYCH